MVFSSLTFIAFFLPVFLASYYIAAPRYRSVVILIGSYLFYSWWRLDFLGLLILVTFVNYWASRKIHVSAETILRKRFLIFGVVFNLSVLGYYKYFNFGIDSFNHLILSIGGQPLLLWNVILPIGISFYIFQAISYLVDVYRKDAPPAANFLDFAAFIALFPQLIAGPVLRYKDLSDQFSQRTHSLDKFSEGVVRFIIGFCKKVVIADSLAPIADFAFAQTDPSFLDAWIGIFAYTAQLYFDFSGYSDMAIGIGLMLGFRFIENFNHPYISRSITEFWRRWHISLSAWLRDYLYIPLGGNRRGAIRTYINLLLTMVFGGLWHGANWTFVCWGLWHGGLLALERLMGVKGNASWSLRSLVPATVTLLLVMVGWVMFRAENMSSAIPFFQGMVGFNGFDTTGMTYWPGATSSFAMLFIAWAIIFLSPLVSRINVRFTFFCLVRRISWLLLFVIAISKLFVQSYSPFLYFQF